MYLGVGMYIVLERGDEMNTVASFIRPFIRLFSFVFRSTDHTAQLHSGRKKPKRKRKQKTKGGSRVHNSRGLNTLNTAWLGTFIARLGLSWKIPARTHLY